MRIDPHVVAVAAGAIALASVAPRARAEDRVEVTFTTNPTSFPVYFPRNILAAWIEDDTGGFVRTLMRYAQRRVANLRAWNAVAQDVGFIDSMPDVITGATRTSHSTLTATWNLTDIEGNPVPYGTYTIRLELTDHDTNSADGNNEGVFTFEHDGQSSEQTGLSGGGFTDVTIRYIATPPPPPDDPNDPPTDPTDPMNPTDPPPPDGDCSLVSACADDDGCCLPDCVYEVDNDCAPGDTAIVGNCSAGGGATPGAMIALLAVFATGRRRRRTARKGCASPRS